MSMYAISENTLTALGDAIRSKVIGTNELPIQTGSYGNNTFDYALKYSAKSLPDYVKKIKIIATLDFTNTMSNDVAKYGTQGLGVASGNFSSAYGVRADSGYTIMFEGYPDNTTLTEKIIVCETIIDSNGPISFVATKDSQVATKFHMSYTAIGLDENGNEFKYTPMEMAEAINGLMTIPDEALNLTGNCNYRFANGGYDWLINQCGDKMTTNNIDSMDSMFACSKVEKIPFEINGYNGTVNVMNCFSSSKIKQSPKINLTKIGALNSIFNNAYYLREISDDSWNVGAYSGHTGSYDNHTNIFNSCYSLRYITPKLLSNIWNVATGYYYSFYYSTFSNCSVLDEIVNLPVSSVGYTSNAFSSTFNLCYRLKDMTFAVNEDGTAKTANWKSQNIDLSNYVGYVYPNNRTYIINWNSGITADKEVIDDATYQALKNDPDWYASDVNYSRYNHDSAVNTINSLPDTSATGTNTIKFKGAAGALTDGGAINTLTEEEIAVATAKGWTVSLV